VETLRIVSVHIIAMPQKILAMCSGNSSRDEYADRKPSRSATIRPSSTLNKHTDVAVFAPNHIPFCTNIPFPLFCHPPASSSPLLPQPPKRPPNLLPTNPLRRITPRISQDFPQSLGLGSNFNRARLPLSICQRCIDDKSVHMNGLAVVV
jgi:hypothetical protein